MLHALYQVLLVLSSASGLALSVDGRLRYNTPGTGPWGEPLAVAGVPASILGGLSAGLSAGLLVVSWNNGRSVSLLVMYGATSVLTLSGALAYALALVHKSRAARAPAQRGRGVRAADYLLPRLASVVAATGILAIVVRFLTPDGG